MNLIIFIHSSIWTTYDHIIGIRDFLKKIRSLIIPLIYESREKVISCNDLEFSIENGDEKRIA
jgi:hypothetical protein